VQGERPELLDEGVQVLGRPLLLHDAPVRPVGDGEPGGEHQHDEDGQRLDARGADRDDRQPGEQQRDGGPEHERPQRLVDGDRHAPQPPDGAEHERAEDVARDQPRVQREPVQRGGTRAVDQPDGEGGSPDLEGGRPHVVERLGRRLAAEDDAGDGGHEADAQVEGGRDEQHAHGQRQLHQAEAVRLPAQLEVQGPVVGRDVGRDEHRRDQRHRDRGRVQRVVGGQREGHAGQQEREAEQRRGSPAHGVPPLLDDHPWAPRHAAAVP
jgi:hypothetical protein